MNCDALDNRGCFRFPDAVSRIYGTALTHEKGRGTAIITFHAVTYLLK